MWVGLTGLFTNLYSINEPLYASTAIYDYVGALDGIYFIPGILGNIDREIIVFGTAAEWFEWPQSISFTPIDNPTYTYWFDGNNGSVAYPSRYTHQTNYPYISNSDISGVSDFGTATWRVWTLNKDTNVVTWPEEYYTKWSGHNTCSPNPVDDPNLVLDVFATNTVAVITLGTTLYVKTTGPSNPFSFILAPFANGVWVYNNSYFETNANGTIIDLSLIHI